ncbi:MAG: hypothetical protein ACJAWO_002386 [Halieaceae bacterium]|jgi:hypothetical protein
MFPVKVVAIDNDQKELDLAIQGLAKANIPLLPIHYDSIEGIDNVIKKPLDGVRIVFCDINLTDSSGSLNAAQVSGAISGVLNKLISKNNGPYVLIFWSKHVNLVEGIKDIFIERYPDTPSPSIIEMMEKNILPSDTHGDESQSANVLHFVEALQVILDNSPVTEILFRWESLCMKSSSETINKLYDVTCSNISWGELGKTEELVGSTLKKIAEGVMGIKNLPDRSANALKEGLTPLLHDNLMNLEDPKFEKSAHAIIKKIIDEKIDAPVDNIALNTFYHVDNQHVSNTERGSFIKVDISPDSNFRSFFKHEWNNIFPDFYNGKFYSEYKVCCKNNGEKKISSNEVRDNSIVGVVEISPACDHAQNKNRNHRYLLMVLIPQKYEHVISREGNHLGVHTLPSIIVDKMNFSPRVNFRYVIGLDPQQNILLESMFRLREQIMNEINFKFAQHASRPGIVSF